MHCRKCVSKTNLDILMTFSIHNSNNLKRKPQHMVNMWYSLATVTKCKATLGYSR